MELECADQQQCEMEALSAIYNTDETVVSYSTNSDGVISGTVEVEVDASAIASVKYLPPIQLGFTLPATYPLADAPRITLACSWLTDDALRGAQKRMDEIWQVEHGMCVLDSYVDSLRHGLGPDGIIVSSTVVAYDKMRRREAFAMQTFTCMICMEPQAGRHCVELESCSHVHCTRCLGDYWAMLISEGSVSQVRCPHPGCRSAPPLPAGEVSRVLGSSHVARYAELSEQRRVDADSGRLAWCPRMGCGQWGARDTVQDKLCICRACGYAFCVWCRRVWHGTSYCAIGSRQRVLGEYRAAIGGGKEAEMERRYGKNVLAWMLADAEADEATERAVAEMAQACPECGVQIVKAYGCNHMQCSQCGSHFCYLCGSPVEPSDPLAHFRSRSSACYMQLLQGVEEEGTAEG
ncbi:hypothetical protein GGI20_004684 [Coemansia sp. BCRC 34301]|nr:hypothetical protein GGI20_004684 [Coemansia sp. BCRC 34301]